MRIGPFAYAATALLAAASPALAQGAGFDWQKYKGSTVEFLANNNPIGQAIVDNKAAFEKLTGITLKIDSYQEQQMRQRLVTVLNARSSEIDVFMTLPSREGLQFDKAGWYANLSPMTKDVAPGYDFAGLSPALLKAATVDGRLTSIPMNVEGPVIYYRRDILQKCHVALPKTLADLEPAAKALKACEPSMAPFVSRGLRDALPYTYSVFFHNMGGQYVVDGRSGFCSKAGLAALSLYGGLLKQYGPPGVVNYSFYQIDAVYRAGRAVMAFEAQNELGNMMQGGARLQDTGLALLPPGPGGSHPTAIGWGMAISPYSKNQGAAWYLVQWATSPEMQAKLEVTGVAAPRASISSLPVVRSWIAQQKVRQEWADAVSQIATTGTSEVGFPIVNNPESRQYMGQAVDDVILGLKTPEKACADADTSLDKLLAQK